MGLALEGLENGHHGALETVWQRAFFGMPLAHCEGPDHLARLDRIVALSQILLDEAPAHLRPTYEFDAGRARISNAATSRIFADRRRCRADADTPRGRESRHSAPRVDSDPTLL